MRCTGNHPQARLRQMLRHPVGGLHRCQHVAVAVYQQCRDMQQWNLRPQVILQQHVQRILQSSDRRTGTLGETFTQLLDDAARIA